MERTTTFVSSRGILKSCDWRNRIPQSSSPQLDFDFPEHGKDGGVFHLCPEAFPSFFSKIYSNIKSGFSLVTCDSDIAISDSLLAHPAFVHLMNNSLLEAWYAQNLVLKSRFAIPNNTKLHALPIGMDYHTMWENPGFWGHERQSPVAQEFALLSVLRDAKPFHNRVPVGHCNFHLASPRGDRKECFEQIEHRACLFEAVRFPRFYSWVRQAQCMFVLSPEGIGIDCHRTWEALLLGCIPVLKRSAFTSIFDGLPVVLLNSWAEFTVSRVNSEINRIASEKFDFSKLFMAHWIGKISRKPSISIPEMTLTEFREFCIGHSY